MVQQLEELEFSGSTQQPIRRFAEFSLEMILLLPNTCFIGCNRNGKILLIKVWVEHNLISAKELFAHFFFHLHLFPNRNRSSPKSKNCSRSWRQARPRWNA